MNITKIVEDFRKVVDVVGKSMILTQSKSNDNIFTIYSKTKINQKDLDGIEKCFIFEDIKYFDTHELEEIVIDHNLV